MSKYSKGDRVRIITKNSAHWGREALVINIHDDKTALVRIDGYQSVSGYFEHEIEPLWAEDATTVLVEVELASSEESYGVAVNLTPEEARGVGKLIAAAMDAENAKGIQFGPRIVFKSVK
jgi:hypothetical protein